MIGRRPTLIAGLAMLPLAGVAQQQRSLSDPMRVGVDVALHESGLAQALQVGFGRDTGIAVKLIAGPAQPLLQALERGELDAALTNAPQMEKELEAQGLVHDRRPIAAGEFVIVGPAPKGKARDPAGLAGARNGAEALLQLRAAVTASTALIFLSANDGSGTHAAEQGLWRAAKMAPEGPWYVNAEPGVSLIAQARRQGAYALVERGAWSAQGGIPLAVLVQGDPGLQVIAQVMRGFRANHPAAKLFSAWIAGPKGRRIVAAQRGYHAPAL
jgi:tungstate transport system substrate-binding protein